MENLLRSGQEGSILALQETKTQTPGWNVTHDIRGRVCFVKWRRLIRITDGKQLLRKHLSTLSSQTTKQSTECFHFSVKASEKTWVRVIIMVQDKEQKTNSKNNKIGDIGVSQCFWMEIPNMFLRPVAEFFMSELYYRSLRGVFGWWWNKDLLLYTVTISLFFSTLLHELNRLHLSLYLFIKA